MKAEQSLSMENILNTSNDSYHLHLQNFKTGIMSWVGVLDVDLLKQQAKTLEIMIDEKYNEDLEGLLSLIESIIDCTPLEDEV